MPLRVAIVGQAGPISASHVRNDLLLRCIALASGLTVELCRPSQAGLTVVYPYALPFRSTVAGSLAEASARRFLGRIGPDSAEALLRRIYRIPAHSRILAVSHENLDRRPWQVFGDLLRESNLPRLTSWPVELDPAGFRFPYWWNYVAWPDVPRDDPHLWTRLGALYDLDALCSETDLPKDFGERRPSAVWLTRHLDFPRTSVLHGLRSKIDVELVQDIPDGMKWDVLKRYQYCVTTENSPGYGYETEKVPDARVSGCLPIGYIQNPHSDFVPEALHFFPPLNPPETLPPLLRQRPTLDPMLDYLSRNLSL